MPGLLDAPAVLTASCKLGSLWTGGSAEMSLLGRCCLSAAVSSDTPSPKEGLVNKSSASWNFAVDTLHHKQALPFNTMHAILQLAHDCWVDSIGNFLRKQNQDIATAQSPLAKVSCLDG